MLDKLKAALEATGIPFAHFAWDRSKRPTGDFGVWAEDSARHLYANGKVQDQTTQGTIDLFTRSDDGAGKEAIQTALKSLDVAWYLNSVQYEEDTRYIHYEWVFEVI